MMRMKLIRILTLAIWIVGVSPAGIRPIFAQSWTNHQTQVTPEKLGLLVNELRKDREASEIIDAAFKKSGANGLGDFVKIISLCPDGLGASGMTSTEKTRKFYWPRLPEEIHELGQNAFDGPSVRAVYSRKIDAFKAQQGLPASAPDQISVDFVGVTVTLDPAPKSICINPSLSVSGAAEVLLHELVHYLYFESPPEAKDPLHYENEMDHESKILYAEGGELDAHIEEYSYRIRTGRASTLPTTVRSLFSPRGDFLETGKKGDSNREAMAIHVLIDRGYRTILADDYARMVRNSLAREKTDREYFQKLLQLRRDTALYEWTIKYAPPEKAKTAAETLKINAQSIQQLEFKLKESADRIARLRARLGPQ
jgi:hypothetical protein